MLASISLVHVLVYNHTFVYILPVHVGGCVYYIFWSQLLPWMKFHTVILFPSFQSVILDTLHWCLQLSPDHGLQCDSIRRLHPLLSHKSPAVRWRVARCLFDLTVPHAGKHTACELQDCLSSLVSLLTDSNAVARSHSAAALMGSVQMCSRDELA